MQIQKKVSRKNFFQLSFSLQTKYGLHVSLADIWHWRASEGIWKALGFFEKTLTSRVKQNKGQKRNLSEREKTFFFKNLKNSVMEIEIPQNGLRKNWFRGFNGFEKWLFFLPSSPNFTITMVWGLNLLNFS